MRYFDNKDSTDLLSNEHIMLLYEDKNKRNNFIIDIINEGLKNGCLCIYASLDLDNSKGISLIDDLSSKVINYEENTQKGNLRFINFKPYYESALKGDLKLFEKLKNELEYLLNKRLSEGKKDKILVFADAACNLSETRNFNECIELEKWWQDVNIDWARNHKNITVVCPHPNSVFKDSEQDIKNKIIGLHDTTFHIENNYPFRYFYNLITNNMNFNDLVNDEQTIEKIKEIKHNFMEEHKNIINTYYTIFSKRLDEMIYHKLEDSKNIEEYSNLYSKTNRNLMDNQTHNTRIINEIMDKNMDTFIKSIKLANKFYSDVIHSYYNYITEIKSSS